MHIVGCGMHSSFTSKIISAAILMLSSSLKENKNSVPANMRFLSFGKFAGTE
jgi:hypothetical protein